MKSLPERTLRTWAVVGLRALFPTSPLVRGLNLKVAAAPSRCTADRACPFPATVDGRCRAHAADSSGGI